MVNQKLVADFITEKGYNTHPNATYTVTDIRDDTIFATEKDESGHYTEKHHIDLIDVLDWLYEKISESKSDKETA